MIDATNNCATYGQDADKARRTSASNIPAQKRPAMTTNATTATHEQYMRIALEEAQRAADEGNVGVGSVIVLDGELIALGRNLVPTTNDPTAHAESVALRKASVALDTDNMAGATMYTTFEPCPMCCGAIMNANIARLVMGGRPTAEQTMWGDYTLERLLRMCQWNDRIEVITGVLVKECLSIRLP